MPLPPLPDDAAIGGAGHIADSDKLEAYLRALAEQYKIDIGVLPDPAPGGDGHVTWHNAIVAGAKKVATAIGAPVTLPPLDVKAGDKSHVTHHNEITKALHDMSEAIPFSVEGGHVFEAYGWRTHLFRNPGGTDKLIVKGKGTVQIIVGGGGGGSGYWSAYSDSPGYQGGGGGGGSLAEMSESQTTTPSVVLNTGEYVVTVGKGGERSKTPTMPGYNGGNTTFVGADVSLTGFGGGGGGSGQAVGASAGTGGGGGCTIPVPGEPPQVNRSGKGNPGGSGVEGSTRPGVVGYGYGGGALGDAVFEDDGGAGLPCGYGDWFDGAVADIYSGNNVEIGAGKNIGVRANSPGKGGNGGSSMSTGGDGVVIVGYKLAQMLGGK